MLRLWHKSLLVFLGLGLIAGLGAWTGATAGPAPLVLNQQGAVTAETLPGSSPQPKPDMQEASPGRLAQMGPGGMMGGQGYCPGGGPGRMGPYQGRPGAAVGQGQSGADLFSAFCIGCHPGGGNSVIPDLPLQGSAQLSNFNTFRSYVRNPVLPNGAPGPMPGFSPGQISDQQMQDLYNYVKSRWGR